MSASERHREPGTHPRHRLAAILQSPVRLSIVACLAAADMVEFAFLRDTVEISDSVLSKQIWGLEEAGLVQIEKGRAGRRPRTWASLTPAGRRAFESHMAALSEIAGIPVVPATPGTRTTVRASARADTTDEAGQGQPEGHPT